MYILLKKDIIKEKKWNKNKNKNKFKKQMSYLPSSISCSCLS